MFGMGLQEILVILVVAVLVIGPEQLPKVARGMGKMFAQFKRATNDLREAVGREMDEHEELAEIKEFKSDLESEMSDIGSTARNYIDNEVKKAEKDLEDDFNDDEKEKPPKITPPGSEIPAGTEIIANTYNDSDVDETKPAATPKKKPRKRKESA